MDKFKLVRDNITMLDYMERFHSSLQRGKSFKCPIHGGENHNFGIKNNRATCFSNNCVRNGDVIKLHSLIHNLSQVKACEDLLDMYGIEWRTPATVNPKVKMFKDRIKLLEVELDYFEKKYWLHGDELSRDEHEQLYNDMKNTEQLIILLKKKIGELNG